MKTDARSDSQQEASCRTGTGISTLSTQSRGLTCVTATELTTAIHSPSSTQNPQVLVERMSTHLDSVFPSL